MPIYRIETTDAGPVFWYKQSCLLLHNSRFFAVDRENYLGELMLSNVTSEKIPVILSYPPVPFCPPYYILRIQCTATQILFHPNCPHAGLSISFYPMRYLPGHPGYVLHIAGRSRDFLTPHVKLIRGWMKEISQDRIRKKMLALAMGLHPRLGLESPLIGLESDLLWSLVMRLQ